MKSLLIKCFQGYRWLLIRTGNFLLFMGALVLLAVAIVTPLWYFSTSYPTLYGILFLILLATALVVPLFLRLIRTWKHASREGWKGTFLGSLKKAGCVLGGVFLGIGVLRFYQDQHYALMGACGILLLFLVGIGLSKHHESRG